MKDVKINAFVSSVGKIKYEYENSNVDFENIEKSIVRWPDLKKSKEMEDLIKQTRKKVQWWSYFLYYKWSSSWS